VDSPVDDEEEHHGAWWEFPPLRSALLAGLTLAATFSLARVGVLPELAANGLYLAAAVLGARYWGLEAFESVFRLRVNIDVLMGAAALGAAALGLWEEAAFLAFLYGAAEALEEITYDRTRSAIRALLELAPKEARVLRDGEETMVPAAELQPGDIFIVRPGESLPTDGVVRSGSGAINEAAITGESVPVEKGPGAEVFPGTVNLTGSLEVSVTRGFADNTLSRIIHLVEEAQEEKTKAQRFIERFGDRYSPAILGLALLLLVVPPLLGADFREWAERAITLTVAGAPCALVMSTPVAVATAIGSAGKHGVLIKGGIHLENLGLVRVIAFDKTGTLTRGQPQVTDVIALVGGSPEQVLALAAAVETFSEHPLALAIRAEAHARNAAAFPATAFESLTGAGAKANVDGREVFVGKPALLESLGIGMDSAAAAIQRLRGEAKTVVLVGDGHQVDGIIAMRDQIRPESAAAVLALRDAGLKVVMLTGDNRETAAVVAGEVGIDDVRAELRPEDKLEVVEDLERTFGKVAMVGDGINDAPALATATVGIAMGTMGTDAAIEAADVALMGDDLDRLVYAVRLGRKTRAISRQNIVFSIALLAVLVPAAVAGLLTVAVAVTAHEVAEIIAVLNGLRARTADEQAAEA
jgi:Cd2+/Zn2+-exporting ATPase